MSDDDHDALAREQEAQADDLEHESERLGDHIDEAKGALKSAQDNESIPTPIEEAAGDEPQPAEGEASNVEDESPKGEGEAAGEEAADR